MAGRNALYLTIAHRCMAQGETGRAIITIVNALTNNPQFLETQPEAVDFLAQILEPGFEEEIHKLEARHPSFGFKLYDALIRHGKTDLAYTLEQSFGAYCIERMKTVQAPHLPPVQPSEFLAEQWSAGDLAVDPRSSAVSTTFNAPILSQNTRQFADPSFVETSDALASVVPNGLNAVSSPAESSDSVQDHPVRYTRLQNSLTNAQSIVRSSAQRERVNRTSGQLRSLRPSNAAATTHMSALDQIAGCASAVPPPQDSAPELISVHALPNDVWISTMRRHQTRYAGQTMTEKHEFTSQNTDAISSDGLRRFDRIRTHQSVETANDYADDAASRVIIDFDNTIRETPKSAMFESTLTKCRTFAEDLAELRASESARPAVKRISTTAHTPLEAVAETTHELNETPSVEPYSVRHPRRFQITPQQILSCVCLCLLCVIGFITWQTTSPALEKRVIEGVSESYIAAAEAGELAPVTEMKFPHGKLVSADWMKSYVLFLEVWKNLHFQTDHMTSIDPNASDFPHAFSAAHAAYIMQEIAKGQFAFARAYLESVDQSIWRDHPYFRTWSEAQIDEAANDLRTASIKYEKLLKSPLAPFATVQLGMLALDEGLAHNDIKQRFIQALQTTESIPANAWCAYDVVSRGVPSPQISRPDDLNQANLMSPYAEYCAIGSIFRSIHNHQPISMDALEQLKASRPLKRAESARLEAIIKAELHLYHPEKAVAFYHDIDLPKFHPQRTHLRHAILSKAMYFGDWNSMHVLNPQIPEDIHYMAAARLIDNAARHDIELPQTPLWSDYILRMDAQRPGNATNLMDEAWQEAERGQYNRAISLTRAVLSANPDHYEPLFLQAWILSQAGHGLDAAHLLEQRMLTGNGVAPHIILSNLYRSRAKADLNHAAYLLPYLKFKDPALESARCEIFWRIGDKRANSCIKALGNQNKTRAAWFMRHTDKDGQPKGASTQWGKLSAGAMTIPGFELAYARKLLTEGQTNAAIRAYTRAILQDLTTATPETVRELEGVFISKKRRYEGTRKFESMIETASKLKRSPELLGALHLSAARLYQPEAAHSMARRHLGSAIEYVGETPEIVRLIIQYYKAKDKPIQTNIWQSKLKKLREPKPLTTSSFLPD